MLTVYRGNRLERLADRLAEVVREPVRSEGVAGAVLAAEVVSVHNRGMARWLSMHLSERLGVCANFTFPLPASFLWQTFRRVLDGVPDASPFDPEVLTWRIAKRVGSLPKSKAFADLRGYLEGGGGDRRYELAYRIADAFDRYLVYRPDWIERWEDGKETHWQAKLWRELSESESAPHRVRLQRDFVERLTAAAEISASDSGNPGAAPPFGLPARVSLFGVAALPPVYLRLVATLARVIDVHLFLLDPCREYWGDIVSDRAIARRGGDAEAQYLESGNPLLSSMGGLGRDFLDEVTECEPGRDEEWFEDPANDASMLAIVQSDILNLTRRGDGDDEAPRARIARDDDSIAIHSCHGPMREVEVLYDTLLEHFRSDPDLRPSDVVVMTPDIETYAPYIEAVFGTVREDARRIPFSIADRSPGTESPLVDVVLELLELSGSRFDATRVTALLESAAVRRRFGLTEDDLEAIQRWMRETGIRWGIDESSRDALDLPATRDHTWREGLDRMLLGYALPGNSFEMFEDILPYDEIEGGDSAVLGRFLSFATALFDLDTDLGRARDPEAWAVTLSAMIETFLAPDGEEEYEVRRIREAVADFAEFTRRADFDEALGRDAVLAHLRRVLGTPDPAAGFLGGGVTFCAMVPMRSIPFAMVCLLGLDDARYPRARKPIGFDLMARDFRRGDRSGRDDDRYLFLEAILSARQRLWISYVGQNIRDNNAIPPSVLVAELLDVLDRGFVVEGAADDESARSFVTTRHPLQAFSPRYFTGSDERLFSFSREQCEASRLAGHGERAAIEFLRERLPTPDEEWRTISIDGLVRFFANPVRFLVQRRLGLYLGRADAFVEGREPFELDRFKGEDLREKLVELRGEVDPEAVLEAVRASGILPQGRVGETVYARVVDAAERFGAQLDAALAGSGDESAPRVAPIDVDLVFPDVMRAGESFGDLRLVGRIDGLRSNGRVEFRAGPPQGRDHTRVWIEHLVLNAAAPADVEPLTRFIHAKGERRLAPVPDAVAHLRSLVTLFQEGLCRPLPFFARTSYAYARKLRHGSEHEAGDSAWRAFNVGFAPERTNPYIDLVLRDRDPLDAEFRAIAEEVFAPMFEHAVERSAGEIAEAGAMTTSRSEGAS